jgi:O-antigen/teichoic acid export membrane protein
VKVLKRFTSGSLGLEKIVANTGWLISGRVMQMVMVFVVGALVARYLGPEQFGALGLATSFAMFFTPLAKLGLDQIVVRDLVARPEHQTTLLGTAFMLKLTVGVMLIPVIVLVATLARPGDDRMPILTLLAAFGMVPLAFDTIDLWFQSLVQSKTVVIARNVSLFLASVARAAGVLLALPLLFFAVVSLSGTLVYAAGQWVAYRLSGQQISAWRFNGRLARQLLKESWPLIISGVAVMVYMRIDQAMLGFMLPGEVGTQAVGVYRVAVSLSEVWYFIPAAVTSSALPSVVQAKEKDPVLYRSRIQKLFNLMALISYGIAIPTIFLAKPVISIYGAEYEAAAPMLVILMWAGLWVSLGLVRSLAIQVEGLMVQSMLATLLGSVLNIGLNLVLIPQYAGLGCAISTTISYGLAAYLSSFLFSDMRVFGRMQTRSLLWIDLFLRIRKGT